MFWQPIYRGVPYLLSMCGADLPDLEQNDLKRKIEKQNADNEDSRCGNADKAKKS